MLIFGPGSSESIPDAEIIDPVGFDQLRLDYLVEESFDRILRTIEVLFDVLTFELWRETFLRRFFNRRGGRSATRPGITRPIPAPIPPGGGFGPEQCLLPDRRISYVEILWDFQQDSTWITLINRGSEQPVEVIIEQLSLPQVPGPFVTRVFFPWSEHLSMLRPSIDLEARSPFPTNDAIGNPYNLSSCPENCAHGCVQWIVHPFVSGDEDFIIAGESHILRVVTEGADWLIFGIDVFAGNWVGRTVTFPGEILRFPSAITNASSATYRVVYNQQPRYQDQDTDTDDDDDEDDDMSGCCSCARVAAIVAASAAAQTTTVGIMMTTQTGIILRALLGGRIELPDFNLGGLTLFDRLFDLGDALQNLRDLINDFRNGDDEETDDDQQPSVNQRLTSLTLAVRRIYNILGGDVWFNGAQDTSPDYQINPEEILRNYRQAVYQSDLSDSGSVQVSSLVGLLGAFKAVNYHRSGHYRLPANLPESMVDDENEGQMEIPDALSVLQWLIVQIDGMNGQYPIKMKYKNADGEEKDLKIQNQAEMLAEIMGLLLAVSSDTDLAVELGMKGIVESIKASNAAILASDYAKANSEFLAYKTKNKVREVPLTITPGARNLRDSLRESKQKIQGVEFDDKEDLRDFIGRLLIGVEIVKAAFYRTFDEDSSFPGERIRQNREDREDSQNTDWGEFIASIENPSGRFRRDPSSPEADIRDLSVDTTPDP